MKTVTEIYEEAVIEGLEVSVSDVQDAICYSGNEMDEMWRILRGYHRANIARTADAEAQVSVPPAIEIFRKGLVQITESQR